jgi:hypothetical protein
MEQIIPPGVVVPAAVESCFWVYAECGSVPLGLALSTALGS